VSNPDNRRTSKREPHQSALSLKIVFASEAPGILGRKLAGETIDISATGLGIVINYKIPIDCTLDVWVTLKESSDKYFLSGKVRWVKPAHEKWKYSTGILLHERSDTKTDLESWKKVFQAQ